MEANMVGWFGDVGVREAFVWIGLLAGFGYGVMAEASRFCVRRALTDWMDHRRTDALIGWLAALAVIIPATQWLIWSGVLKSDELVYFPSSLSWWATALGAFVFGLGMSLTRGCPARLLVLTASGNLRALAGVLVIGLSAYAVFKGVLADNRLILQASGGLQIPQSPVISWFGDTIWWGIAASVSAALLWTVLRAGIRKEALGGLGIGGLIVATWWITAQVGADDFDPMAPASLSFVVPIGDAMVYTMLASGISASFTASLVGGVLVGAFVSALVGGRLQWQTFQSPVDQVRYTIGAVCMGFGGVLALGCTTGQALVGVGTLSAWSIAVTLLLFAGAWVGHRFIMR